MKLSFTLSSFAYGHILISYICLAWLMVKFYYLICVHTISHMSINTHSISYISNIIYYSTSNSNLLSQSVTSQSINIADRTGPNYFKDKKADTRTIIIKNLAQEFHKYNPPIEHF